MKGSRLIASGKGSGSVIVNLAKLVGDRIEGIRSGQRGAAIRSRDNSGGSRVIKQPHTLENYRNGQESCNKETREDKA